MNEDAQLLLRYAEDRSEAAFADLIRLHVDLVYSAALRLVNGDAHAAQDVTQQVFAEAARQAKSLARHPSLVGWLYTTTRQMAWRMIRTEQRRLDRERTAHAMNELLSQSPEEPEWESMRPVLDEAMHDLNQADRLAVLLRFFKNKSLRDVGLALGLNENTARMRVDRALDKLRKGMESRGVTSSAAALAAALSGNAVQAAPAGFAAALAGAAWIGAASQNSSTFGILKLMATTKLKIGLAALVVTGAVVTLVLQHQALVESRRENDHLRDQIAQWKADNDALSKRIARAERTRSSALGALGNGAGNGGVSPASKESHGSLYDRLVNNPLKVSTAQMDDYLKSNRRSASSLLAAYRVTHDPALLQEAMQKYPNDPQVDFEAAFQTNATPEQRRQWLNAFETAAPDNALANYLSALDYFKSGQPDQALQEMAAASGKQGFQDYTTSRLMDDREAYSAAGYTMAEAEVSSGCQLLLPQLQQVKSLGLDLIDLAKNYQQAGDADSAQTALQMAAAVGQRYATDTPAEPEISQLVGMKVEQLALNAMDPNAPYGDNGQTVQDQLNQMEQHWASVNALDAQVVPLLQNMSDDDWVTYRDRWVAFGETAAAQWLINKYGQQP